MHSSIAGTLSWSASDHLGPGCEGISTWKPESPLGKAEHSAEGSSVVQMTDPLEATPRKRMTMSRANGLVLNHLRDNCSHLLDSWSIVATADLCWIHCDANRHAVLLLLRLLLQDLMSLLYTSTYGLCSRSMAWRSVMVEGARLGLLVKRASTAWSGSRT